MKYQGDITINNYTQMMVKNKKNNVAASAMMVPRG